MFRFWFLSIVLTLILTSVPASLAAAEESRPPATAVVLQEAWPPVRVNMRAMQSGDVTTFWMTVVNRSNRSYSFDLRAKLPDGANLLESWAGVVGVNPGRSDGMTIGWMHPNIAGNTSEGPFVFSVRSDGPVSSYPWIRFFNNSPSGEWTGRTVSPRVPRTRLPQSATAQTGENRLIWR